MIRIIVRLPGTEHIDEAYHQKKYHYRCEAPLGDYSWIPYWRGSVYALRLMGMIEAQTGTDHAFKDLMMAVKDFDKLDLCIGTIDGGGRRR